MEEARRQHPRYPAPEVVVIAQFATSRELFRVSCRDIGLGGVFLETRHRVPVGQGVMVTLKLPTDAGPRTVELPAEVVRVDDEGGVALAFRWPEEEAREAGAASAARDALSSCLARFAAQ